MKKNKNPIFLWSVLMAGLLIPSASIVCQENLAEKKETVNWLQREYRLIRGGVSASIKRMKGQKLSQEEQKQVKGLALRVVGVLAILGVAAVGGFLLKKKGEKPVGGNQYLEPGENEFFKTDIRGTASEVNIEKFQRLLDQGANIEQTNKNEWIPIIEPPDKDETIADIHMDAKKGNIIELQRLLDQGANIEQTNKKGWTPLHFAIRAKQPDTVRFLLKQEAKISDQDFILAKGTDTHNENLRNAQIKIQKQIETGRAQGEDVSHLQNTPLFKVRVIDESMEQILQEEKARRDLLQAMPILKAVTETLPMTEYLEMTKELWQEIAEQAGVPTPIHHLKKKEE